MSKFSHAIHFIITILFFPWTFVWLAMWLNSSSKKSVEDEE